MVRVGARAMEIFHDYWGRRSLGGSHSFGPSVITEWKVVVRKCVTPRVWVCVCTHGCETRDFSTSTRERELSDLILFILVVNTFHTARNAGM